MPQKGRGAAATRPLDAAEHFHTEQPLLCVATDVRHEGLLCRACLSPLGLAADHVRAAAPDLLESDELRPALVSNEAQELCVAVASSCARCDARYCGSCVGRDAQKSHACAGLSALRDRWPKLVASPRFRLFVQALGRVVHGGEDAAAVAAAIESLCHPVLPGDGNALASAAMEAELAEPLALLHCALVRERLNEAQEGETAMETSAALGLVAAWCNPTGYRNFERRVATNAHGLRFASPASAVLVAAMAACPTLSAAAQDCVMWAVAGVGDDCELPFYCATAVFAQASALNHSCNPSAEVLSCERAELRMRCDFAQKRMVLY